MNLIKGRLNSTIGGQLGSEGKGAVASHIGYVHKPDIAITNAGANSGHTFYRNGKKYVTHFLPVSGVLSKRCQIYLCAGAIIDPAKLKQELDEFNIPYERVRVHPRTTVITGDDIRIERETMQGIASTCTGNGAALVRKIQRKAKLAQDDPFLKQFTTFFDLKFYLDQGCTAFMEVPQGYDLSINNTVGWRIRIAPVEK